MNIGGSAPSTASSGVGNTLDAAPGSTSAANGSEIVLNLGTLPPRELITIGVGNGANGAEQLTVAANQAGQTPEQVTLNLNQTTIRRSSSTYSTVPPQREQRRESNRLISS
jgi:hypothetical protein